MRVGFPPAAKVCNLWNAGPSALPSSFSTASVIGHLMDTDGVRTHDPLLAKQMFYQLNYWPNKEVSGFSICRSGSRLDLLLMIKIY